MTRIRLTASNDCLASDYTIHHATISNYVNKTTCIYIVYVCCVFYALSVTNNEYSRTFLFPCRKVTALHLSNWRVYMATALQLIHSWAMVQLWISSVGSVNYMFSLYQDLWVVRGCTELLPSCPSHSPCALLLISHYQHIVQLFELAACHIYIDVPPVVGCMVCQSELCIASRKGYH